MNFMFHEMLFLKLYFMERSERKLSQCILALKIVSINMVKILMMSGKMATLGLLKIKVF